MKQDRDVTAVSVAAQNTLADAIHITFGLLTSCLQSELSQTMPAFLSPDTGRFFLFLYDCSIFYCMLLGFIS